MSNIGYWITYLPHIKRKLIKLCEHYDKLEVRIVTALTSRSVKWSLLCYTALHYDILYYNLLYYITLHHISLCYITLHYVILYYIIVKCRSLNFYISNVYEFKSE